MKIIQIFLVLFLYTSDIFAQACRERIRVGKSCSGHVCSAVEFDDLPYEEYVQGVLTEEWGPNWTLVPASLAGYEAGAISIRSLGLKKIAEFRGSHGVNYDICNSNLCQIYNPALINPFIIGAVTNTKNKIIVDIQGGGGSNGTIYLAEQNYVCGNPTLSGVPDPVCLSTETKANGMCSRGSVKWATGRTLIPPKYANFGDPHGLGTKTTVEILNHYYPNTTIIECGKNPVFKLPYEKGLSYKVSRSGIYSPYPNDKQGMVYLTTDKHNRPAIDFDIPNGLIGDDRIRVLASAKGTVILAEWENINDHRQGYGLYVAIRHDDGSVTYYGHNDELCVSPNDIVGQGNQIAWGGNTGKSDGDHIHWELRAPGGVKGDEMWGTFIDCGYCTPASDKRYTSENELTKLCGGIVKPPLAPNNDDCYPDPAEIEVHTNRCNYTNGDLTGATTSGGIATCDCSGSTIFNDVWYTYFVPVGGGYNTVRVVPEQGLDVNFSMYRSDLGAAEACMSPVTDGCRNGGGDGKAEEWSVGNTLSGYYLIRVYGYGSTTKFDICVTNIQGSNTFPPQLTINPNTAQTICQGNSVTLAAGVLDGATSYQWYNSGAPISGATNPTYLATATGSYTVGGKNGSVCLRTSDPTSVTVNPNVDAGTVSGTSPLCLNQTATYTSNGTPGGSWSIVAGTGNATVDANGLVTPSAAGNCDVQYTVNSGCGSPVSAFKTLTINSLPVAAAGTAQSICNGSSTTIGATTVTGSTYSWSPVAGLSSTTVSNPTATPATTTTYYVTETITSTGCNKTNSVEITVKPNPTVTVPSNSTVCHNAAIAATNFTSNPTGATYTWTNSNIAIGLTASGSGNVPAFTATNTTAAAISGTISVTATLNSCTGSASSYTITVNPNPTVTVPSNSTVCHNAAIAATNFTSNPTGATYTWTNSNIAIGLTASGSGNVPAFTATNTTAAAISGTISVTPTLNSCTGSASSYTITVNPKPTVTVPSNSTVCPGNVIASTNFTSNPTGATYTWTNNNISIGLAASGTGQVPQFTATNATAANISGNIIVTPTLNGCTGTASSYTITVKRLYWNIEKTAENWSKNNCGSCMAGSTPVYIVPASTISSCISQADADGLAQTEATNGDTQDWANANGACAPSGPTPPTGSASQTFCSGATVANLAATGTDIKWYANPSGGSALGSTIALTSAHYYATQTVSGCESLSRFDVTVTVGGNYAWISSYPSNPKISCVGDEATLMVTAYDAVGGIDWFVSYNGGMSWNPISSFEYTCGNELCSELYLPPLSLDMDGYIYKCIAYGGQCGNDEVQTTLDIYTYPTYVSTEIILPNPPNCPIYCGVQATVTYNGGSGNFSYTWFKQSYPATSCSVSQIIAEECWSSTCSNICPGFAYYILVNDNYTGCQTWHCLWGDYCPPPPPLPPPPPPLPLPLPLSTELLDIHKDQIIQIYPNPSQGSVIVDMTFIEEQPEVMIEVINILGEIVSKETIKNIQKHIHQINLSKYGAGVYFIKIAPTDEELAVRQKVVVMK